MPHRGSENETTLMFSAYSEAVALKCRESGPLATYSIDRRAIANYSQASSDDQIFMGICFCCARRFPHVASDGARNEIRWAQPLRMGEEILFFGMTATRCDEICGLDMYIERYGHQPGFPDMRNHMAEFEDWQLHIPFLPRHVTILCCPEDRECKNKQCMSGNTICPECRIPVCLQCERSFINIDGPRMPQAALANDLMVFYAPSILYERQVTCMELICASVCLTTMITFTLEKKYRGVGQRLFDQDVHMQRHTVGMRGNATSFPMPWEEILLMLQNIDEHSENTTTVDLPHTGEKLHAWVQVLLKTSGEDDMDDLKGLVHQGSC